MPTKRMEVQTRPWEAWSRENIEESRDTKRFFAGSSTCVHETMTYQTSPTWGDARDTSSAYCRDDTFHEEDNQGCMPSAQSMQFHNLSTTKQIPDCESDQSSSIDSHSSIEKLHLIYRFTFIEVVSEPEAPAESQCVRRSCSLPPRLETRNPSHSRTETSEYVDSLMERAAQLCLSRKSQGHDDVFSIEPCEFAPNNVHSSHTDETIWGALKMSDWWGGGDRDGDFGQEANSLASGMYAAEPTCQSDAITTLMLCGLSKRMTQTSLVEILVALGYGGQFDLVHMPRSAKSFAGYAFINFVTVEFARNFAQAFDTFAFNLGRPGVRPHLRIATCQGSDATRASTKPRSIDKNPIKALQTQRRDNTSRS